MKNLFILLVILINLEACEVFRPASRTADNTSGSNSGQTDNSQPSFINHISTNSDKPSEVSTPKTTTKKTASTEKADPYSATESYDPLQYKYAILTNSPVELLTNEKLLVFMDEWYGTPYHYGGTNKDGIDCSAFASLLLSDVYQVNQLPRISADQYAASRRISRKELREGDLVFFHTYGKGKRVTHVGVYLYNNRFVHASVSGVQINDLGEGYYLQHYVGAGRVTGNDTND